VYPTDVETRKQLAIERAASLALAGQGGAKTERRARQRFGFWLVEVGLRLACDGPVPSRA
jgi:hypothetical protein